MHYLSGACLSVLQTLTLVVSPRDRPHLIKAPQQYYQPAFRKQSQTAEVDSEIAFCFRGMKPRIKEEAFFIRQSVSLLFDVRGQG